MWIKKRKLSLSLSLFLLLSLFLSFFLLFSLSPLLSLSLQFWRSPHSHTQMLPPLRGITASKDRRERNLHCPEKNVNMKEEKRKYAKLSLSLISPPSSSSLSSSHSLSLLLLSAYIVIDFRANTLLNEGCQCLNIFLLSSCTQSPLIISVGLPRIWGCCLHQSTGVVCGSFVWMGEEEKRFFGMKNSMKIIFLSKMIF